MSAEVDIAAPFAWDGLCVNDCAPRNPGMVARLGGNLGFRARAVCACPHGSHRDAAAAQRRAWDLVRGSIDEGWPCIGFELADPNFFLINGYGDEEYAFLALDRDGEASQAAVRWESIGRIVGWIRVQAIISAPPAPDEVVVRDALRAATEVMTREHDGGMFLLGLAGYDLWAAALENGAASDVGHRANAAAWAELKAGAVGFLREATERLPSRADDLFDEAIAHYAAAAGKLEELLALHTAPAIEGELIRSPEAAALVREAEAAEREGFPLLARIAEAV
jgi:hypothetical protein